MEEGEEVIRSSPEENDKIEELFNKFLDQIRPGKSREEYDQKWREWLEYKKLYYVTEINEKTLGAYFELKNRLSPKTLIKDYSILKSNILANHNIDISKKYPIVLKGKKNTKLI